MQFQPYPKVPRLERDVVITEKLDGTNASVTILLHGYEYHVIDGQKVTVDGTYQPFLPDIEVARIEKDGDTFLVLAGSRKRWVTPGKGTDNFGFAGWVYDNADELLGLGLGTHFGEWWGKGIQRGYGLDEKRFSLFNVHKWQSAWRPDGKFLKHASELEAGKAVAPDCCHVVPVIHMGLKDMCALARSAMYALECNGSYAAPGYRKPEGIMIYHTAAGQMFKKTFEGDLAGKERS